MGVQERPQHVHQPQEERTAVTELCIAVLASRAVVTSYHKFGGLKKIYHSRDQKSLQQKCQQDWFHLEALGEKSSHAFIQTSVGDSGHSFTSKFITPVSASIFTRTSPSLCLSVFPFSVSYKEPCQCIQGPLSRTISVQNSYYSQ